MQDFSTDKCRDAVLAGTLLRAMQDMKEKGIKELTIDNILKATGASRSQAYTWASRVCEWRETQAGPGRPKSKEAPTKPGWDKHSNISALVRDWLMAHPGAVCTGGKRSTYSDAFRSFVLDLMAPGGPLAVCPQARASEACGVPHHTLVSWLSAGKRVTEQPVAEEQTPVDEPAQPPEAESDDEAEVEPPSSQFTAKSAHVIALWKKWKGPFGAFCRSLKDHGIEMPPATVSRLLSVSGERKRKRRRGSNPDAEAIRGELMRFFPNAQWGADGKNLYVKVGDDLVRFSLELIVDIASSAHLGFSIRDNEDSVGLLGALEQATETTGKKPIALIRDPRKCNFSDSVETYLSEEGVISMRTSVGRPQTNGQSENAFSHIEQRLPVPCIPKPDELTSVEMARLVISYMILGYCVGRNHTPRLRLKKKTPAEAYVESMPTEEMKAEAREQLLRLKRLIEEQSQADRKRCRPETLKMVREGIQELGLSDPDDRYAPAIANYGMEAALEALAVFKAKKEADTLPKKRNHERYLLGIARNVSYRNEDQRVYESLISLRTQAGDLLRTPLDELDSQMRSLSKDAYIDKVLNLSLKSSALIDRTYWRNKLLNSLSEVELAQRTEIGKHCARKVAARQSISTKERNIYIAELAKCVAPMDA